MRDKYTLVHEGLSQWINSPNNGGECCQTWADTVDELNRLLARIKRLEEAGQKVEDAAYSVQDWSGTALGDALDELNKAKEAKP